MLKEVWYLRKSIDVGCIYLFNQAKFYTLDSGISLHHLAKTERIHYVEERRRFIPLLTLTAPSRRM